MSSDFAIRLRGVSKCYAVYDRPEDRLLQYFLPWMVGILPKFLQSVLPERIRRARHFREFWSLHGVTLDVRRGESVGIIGMNGAGKSTLLQLVAGILAPTSGEVEVNGRIAGLFELGSGFNPDFTGRENVLLNGAILGFSRAEIEEKMQEILDFAAIGDFVDQPVKTYSSGMVVRLAFAVQVQLEPDILIVDEALAVGDALFQKRCFSRIEKFLANGGTLLFVSHDQETVRTLTDRAVLLRHGRVERVGTSSEVVLEYRRLLHEEENRYARVMLQSLTRQAGPGEAGSGPVARVANTSEEGPRELSRSSLMAFGDLDVEVVSTTVHDGAGNICDLFYPGDVIRVRIGYEARHEATHLNLGLRLRNKEGVKIYSAGTFNDDLATSQEEGTTWSRTFRAGEHFVLEMEFPCILGEGFYEIQAYVTEEEVFAPGHQRTLHWVDEAAFFRVSMNRFSRWYGGVCDLAPRNRVLANGA